MKGAARHAGLVSLGLLLAPPAWAQATAPEPHTEASEPIIEVSPEGFTLTTPDKRSRLRLRGNVQADGRFFVSEADRPGATTLLVRRARPILEGTVFGAIDAYLMPDFGSGSTSLQDAYVDFRPWSELRLRGGKFKAPVGLERLQPDFATLFIERALPTNLVPNRDVGVQFHGDVHGGLLNYALGFFNGVPDGGSADANTDNSFDLVGRLFVRPFRATPVRALKDLGLGFGASRGPQFGTAANPGVAPLVTTGQQTFFSYRKGATLADTVVADGAHLRLSPQGSFYWGPVGVFAEYVSSSQDVRLGAARARVRNEAWEVSGSCVLFGGKAAFDGVRPEKPLRLSEHTWGAVELAARYAVLSIDPDAFPVFADPDRSAREAKDWGVAVNWYVNTNVRIAANYAHTHFAGGAPGGSRTPESLFLSRFQVAW